MKKGFLLGSVLVSSAGAFTAPAFLPNNRPKLSLDCICINCAHVTNCKAYWIVEEQHGQPHINEDPTFDPPLPSPKIHVKIRNIGDPYEDEGQMHYKPDEMDAKLYNEANPDKEKIGGTEVFENKMQSTIEYDVIECEAFKLDQGAWVRNMPEEIRIANPDFVPP